MLRLLLALLLYAGATSVAYADASGVDFAKAAQAAQAQGDLDAAIRLYSQAAVTSGTSIENLAIIYNNRGIAFWSKGQLDNAIADYSAALKLEPDYVEAFHNRGIAYRDKGDRTKEIADYTEALRRQPEDAFAYENRGRARLHIGQIDMAIEDLATAVAIEPADAYAVLWLHLARIFAKQNDTIEFTQNAGKINHAEWPGPILDLYLSTTTPEKVRLAAAAAPDSQTLLAQSCEADFYIGAFELLKGTSAEAKRLFQEAAARCPSTYLEHGAAKAQLERLGH